MAKPLVSANPQPQDIQFKHFGVMNAGEQSKGSLFTSAAVNISVLLLLLVVISAGGKKLADHKDETLAYVVPVKPLPPDPPKPKPPLPKPPPPKPPPPEPPKLVKPLVIPDPPKIPTPPVPVAKPVPVIVNSAPKLVTTAAAPKVVSVKMPTVATSIKNNDAHPSPVALGNMTNPVAVSNRPAVATKVSLGNAGAARMPPENGGRGPVSAVNIGGNGGPRGGLTGTGVRPVAGIPNGIPHGTGTGPGNGTGGNQVSVVKIPQQPQQVAAINPPVQQKAAMRSGPTVTYKPPPVYTAEAKALHLEGVVSVRIKVLANGAVQVIGITSGLGHGLDESARQVCQGMRFKPALDANGNPIDWTGEVKVTFQMA